MVLFDLPWGKVSGGFRLMAKQNDDDNNDNPREAVNVHTRFMDLCQIMSNLVGDTHK